MSHCLYNVAERMLFMRIKEIIISSVLTLLAGLVIFGAFKLESSFEVPESKILVSDFEGGIVNTLNNEISLLEYGNLAIENKSIIGKGVMLNDGHLTLYESDKTQLRDEFTFSTWFNIVDTTPIDPMLLSRASTAGDIVEGPLSIHFSDNYTYFRTDLTFKLANSEYGSYSFCSKEFFNQDTIKNEWHNLTVVFDKNILYYYYDGVLSSAEILPVELLEYVAIANNKRQFEIGRGGWGNMLGLVDEVYFYDYAVGKEEAISFYTKGMEKFKNKLVMKLESDVANVNGAEVPAPALVEEKETVMVSADFIVEKMGGTLSFDGEDGYGRVDIVLGNDKVSLWVMDTNAIVNDKFSKLNVYPIKKDDIVFVPVRFIAESLGAMTSWNEELGEITIYYK